MRLEQFLRQQVSRRGRASLIGLSSVPSYSRPALDADGMQRSVTLIGSSRRWHALNARELWSYRELLYFFIWRDLKVRYKQTALGASWAVIQPFLTMIVFSVFFGRLASIHSGDPDIPYPLFVLSGSVLWTFFANALTQASNSVVSEERLITKIYFPRLLIPAAAVLAGLVDFAIAFVALLGMQAYYGALPSAAVLLLPAFIVLAVLTSFSLGLWLSALNVQYRDIRYAVPFLIQFWLFATPIAYPSSLVPGHWRAVYGLNPMVGVVDGFRWALLGQDTWPGVTLVVSSLTVMFLLLGGLYYFRHAERTFADVV